MSISHEIMRIAFDSKDYAMVIEEEEDFFSVCQALVELTKHETLPIKTMVIVQNAEEELQMTECLRRLGSSGTENIVVAIAQKNERGMMNLARASCASTFSDLIWVHNFASIEYLSSFIQTVKASRSEENKVSFLFTEGYYLAEKSHNA